MRILFLGAGAIGGYFGGRMAQSGADITFLVRENRASQLTNGLQIESPIGNATVQVETIYAGEPGEPFDVIVLTSKAYGLTSALEAISPHVRDGTAIVPLLNGLKHLEQIDSRFPNATVWGGVAQIPATLSPDGIVKHLGTLQGMIIGPRPGQHASRSKAEEVVAIAANAGINARFTESIEQDMWDKWVFLTTLAASTCLTRSRIGAILKADQGEAFLLGLLDECTAVAAAEGFRPSEDRMAGYRGQLTDRSSSGAASMLRDIEQGNQIEADHIVGDMLRRARSFGNSTPRLDTVWMCLQCYETSRQAASQK
jgi:2-dehydropantoate 2-reductase